MTVTEMCLNDRQGAGRSRIITIIIIISCNDTYLCAYDINPFRRDG